MKSLSGRAFGFLNRRFLLQDCHYSVSLHVSHPDIDPELISRALALQPTHRATRMGEVKTTPKGTPREGRWEFSHWSHNFEIVQDGELAAFMWRLTEMLEPHGDFLRRIVDEGGAVECFVGIFTDTNCDQILPFDLLGKLAELRVDLRLDLYGSKLRQVEHPRLDADGTESTAEAGLPMCDYENRGIDRSAAEDSQVEPATWDNCRADFVFDGAFIDLIVPGTGFGEWEAFWSALKAGPFELRTFREGASIPLPESAAWIFAEREAAPVFVSVLSGTVIANCHFNGGDLQLDIDPREVINEQAFESVLKVMRFVARAVELPMLAVIEGGSPEYAFVWVSPDGQAEFRRSGSVRHAN
jgi:hypothetical protein